MQARFEAQLVTNRRNAVLLLRLIWPVVAVGLIMLGSLLLRHWLRRQGLDLDPAFYLWLAAVPAVLLLAVVSLVLFVAFRALGLTPAPFPPAARLFALINAPVWPAPGLERPPRLSAHMGA